MTDRSSLMRALAPNRIAVIGASDRSFSRGSYIWRALCMSPMGAQAVPVNPKYRWIGEHRAWPSIKEVPGDIDLAVIALRADRVLDALEECGEKQVGAVLIATEEAAYAADRVWLEQIQTKAQELGLTIIGPDSLGLMVPADGLNVSFWPEMARAGNIALLTQSGLIATSMIDYAQEAELGFSSVVTTGAELQVGMADFLKVYADDRATKVIAIQVEALTDPRRFYSALRRAARLKHVVVLKSGNGSGFAADRLASFRYGTDAGDDDAFERLVARAGAQCVHTFEAFIAAVSALASNRLPRGNRLAVISNDAAFAALCADAAEGLDAHLHTLSHDTIHALEKAFPSPQIPVNPIHVGPTASAQRFSETLDIVLRDPMIDGAIVIVAPGPISTIDPTLHYLAKTASASSKPVITAWVSSRITRSVRSQLRRVPNAPISAIQTPSAAARAFAALVYRIRARNRRLVPSSAFRPELNPEALERFRAELERARANGHTQLDVTDLKTLFDLIELPSPTTHLVKTPDEAVELASRLGYPVCLKVAARGLTHKTRVGGVVLSISDDAALRRAWTDIEANVKEAAPMAEVRGMTLQSLVSHSPLRALSLGIQYDHVLGPLVVVSPADPLLRAAGKKALALPPFSADEAVELLSSPGLSEQFNHRRDLPDIDASLLGEILCRFSLLPTLIPAIESLTLNPIVWTEHGPVVLDGQLKLSESSTVPDRAYSHLTIASPPLEESTTWTLKTGESVTVRPLLPSDYRAFLTLVDSLTEKSAYLRFHTTGKIPAERIAELSQPDWLTESAWSVWHDGTLIATGRWSETLLSGEVEFGVEVADAWHRKGVANRLMDKLEHEATLRGYTAIMGHVLRGNAGMQALMTKRGYTLDVSRETRDTDCWVKAI